MRYLIFLILILVLLIGCSSEPTVNSQIANPASVHCLENNGQLEMRTNEYGQYGVCIFSDGSECEEWAFFRNECSQGGAE